MKRIKISEIILESYHKFWSVANKGKFLHYVLAGGRASAKSTHICIWLIKHAMASPETILCIRKVQNTLRGSVLEQLKEAIDFLGVTDKWRVNNSLLELTYLPRGNKILLRGTDDPQKLKSIKANKYPITTLFVEELAEFKDWNDMQVIINSIVRAELPAGMKYRMFYAYNPPTQKHNWVNKKFETKLLAQNIFFQKTTYLDNKFISKQFIEEALTLKERNERSYRHIYLGEAIGSGVVPFDNLVFRTISDEEVQSFDNFKTGLDFGFVDPTAVIRLHYDRERRTIYVLDELFQQQLSNRSVAKWLQKKDYMERVICDCANPRDIKELVGMGINAKKCKKGQGSVEFNYKWLRDLDAIVIDPRRTPNTCREFESADFAVDRFGEVLEKLADKDNHSIDAVAYALNNDMRTVNLFD